ncbi:hypothetical protein [Paraburkholderia lycopersici]|uniref:hypothetical protein n=1 Tax=Paraburkholderia lycopersici TaxID=416944 RepID=UPI000B833F1F|nr:hypothetical protein [Paraburkholderia lycopersici]
MKRWIVEVKDSLDGSGDGILQLPDALWEELAAQGWRVDDVLEIEQITEHRTVVIRNGYAECRRLSVQSKP